MQETSMMLVSILITDGIASVVDARLRLPTETLSQGMQAGM